MERGDINALEYGLTSPSGDGVDFDELSDLVATNTIRELWLRSECGTDAETNPENPVSDGNYSGVSVP